MLDAIALLGALVSIATRARYDIRLAMSIIFAAYYHSNYDNYVSNQPFHESMVKYCFCTISTSDENRFADTLFSGDTSHLHLAANARKHPVPLKYPSARASRGKFRERMGHDASGMLRESAMMAFARMQNMLYGFFSHIASEALCYLAACELRLHHISMPVYISAAAAMS